MFASCDPPAVELESVHSLWGLPRSGFILQTVPELFVVDGSNKNPVLLYIYMIYGIPVHHGGLESTSCTIGVWDPSGLFTQQLVCEACNGMLYFPLLGWEVTLLTMDFRDPWGSNGWLTPWVYPRFWPIQSQKELFAFLPRKVNFWFRDVHPGIDPENEHGWRENHRCLFWYEICILSSSNGWFLPIVM